MDANQRVALRGMAVNNAIRPDNVEALRSLSIGPGLDSAKSLGLILRERLNSAVVFTESSEPVVAAKKDKAAKTVGKISDHCTSFIP